MVTKSRAPLLFVDSLDTIITEVLFMSSIWNIMEPKYKGAQR